MDLRRRPLDLCVELMAGAIGRPNPRGRKASRRAESMLGVCFATIVIVEARSAAEGGRHFNSRRWKSLTSASLIERSGVVLLPDRRRQYEESSFGL